MTLSRPDKFPWQIPLYRSRQAKYAPGITGNLGQFMPIWLYPTGANAGWAFLIVTVLLGGGAAFASGRAIADTWRPAWQVPLYMLLLGLGVRFVQFAVLGATLLSWSA